MHPQTILQSGSCGELGCDVASVTCSTGDNGAPAIATFLTRASVPDVVACISAFARERRLNVANVRYSINWPDGLTDAG